MRLKRLVLVAATAAVCAAAFFATYALAANFQTYYCGTSSSYCTMGQVPAHTCCTGLRDLNAVHCQNTICHSDVWYYNSQLGGYGLRHSNGQQDNSIGTSAGYAEADCATTVGYGSNTARCWTNWHT
jgi:hypothetical protein